MYFKDFKHAILENGGTFDDVWRLNDEGHRKMHSENVVMFLDGEFGDMTVEEFDLWCYEEGRELVLENLGKQFYLRKQLYSKGETND